MLHCDGYVKAEATNNEARCIISIEESVSTLTKRNIEMNKIVSNYTSLKARFNGAFTTWAARTSP